MFKSYSSLADRRPERKARKRLKCSRLRGRRIICPGSSAKKAAREKAPAFNPRENETPGHRAGGVGEEQRQVGGFAHFVGTGGATVVAAGAPAGAGAGADCGELAGSVTIDAEVDAVADPAGTRTVRVTGTCRVTCRLTV